MASINRLKRELLFKIVFYGPGLGGKTTTLQHVHASTKAENRGNMVSLATDTDRTLYFDYLPVRLLKLGDMTVKLQLYTVPGQVYYGATRKLVLSGTDGIVFVADSQSARLDANVESLDDLNSNLAEQGRKLSSMPHAFQYNKRDLPDIVSVEELDRRLNLFGAPALASVATEGKGVFDILERVTRLVVEGYRAELPALGGKGDQTPLFLDAEEVGLTDAIRELADSQRIKPPSTGRRPLEQPPPLAAAAVGGRGASPAAAALASPVAAPVASPVAMPIAPPLVAAPVASPLGSPAATSAASPQAAPYERIATPPPADSTAGFSLAELWPASDRDVVRRAEAALAAKNAVAAVTACEDLLSRILAAGSLLLGGQGQAREPALVVLLLNLDGTRYLGFRAATRALRAKREPSLRDALACYAFVLEARHALDRAAKGP
jgi:signal recognition particle receptor subunit beta